MGTRALIVFKDEEEREILTLYRQHDGDPSSLGYDLKRLLKGRSLVNGFKSGQTTKDTFNGMGCLAAYVTGKLKGDELGEVYVRVPGIRNVGEEYLYEIFPLRSTQIGIRIFEAQ